MLTASVHQGLHDGPQPGRIVHVRVQSIHVHGHVYKDGHRCEHQSPITSISLSQQRAMTSGRGAAAA